jgi:hypothetical protein
MLKLPRPFTRMFGTARANMFTIGIAYTVYALSLLLQPRRWSRTPAYHLLLEVIPADAWGCCFAVAAAGLFAAVATSRHRWLVVAALSAAGAITVAWALAFLVRWATNGSTTPETWVSWAVNAYLLIRAAAYLDYQEIRPDHLLPRTGKAP